MGLDMYLTGRKFLRSDWETPANNRTEDGFEIETINLRLGYWRKHPDLHGYIVQTFANGVDECQEIDLTADHLQLVIDAIKADGLPHTEGFFFGRSENDEDEKKEAIAIFEAAIAWLKVDDGEAWRDVFYRASW